MRARSHRMRQPFTSTRLRRPSLKSDMANVDGVKNRPLESGCHFCLPIDALLSQYRDLRRTPVLIIGAATSSATSKLSSTDSQDRQPRSVQILDRRRRRYLATAGWHNCSDSTVAPLGDYQWFKLFCKFRRFADRVRTREARDPFG